MPLLPEDQVAMVAVVQATLKLPTLPQVGMLAGVRCAQRTAGSRQVHSTKGEPWM